MHGLIEVDITEAAQRLAKSSLSFTAFVVASVARAVARHPEVHAYRDWLGRIVVHHYVDVTTLIEVQTDDGFFPLAHLVRDADVRSVAEISDEIRSSQRDPNASVEGRHLTRFARAGGRIPGLAWIVYQAMSRSTKMREVAGTVSVSSVGMFGGGPGHGIGFPTVLSLSILVGGRTRRPVAAGDEVVVREVVDLTVTFDHNTVDGGPAARFVADLRNLLSTGAALD